MSPATVEDLLAGRITITLETARRVSGAVGGSVEFWMARDGQYWEDAARLESDAWVASLPVVQMEKLGWMGPAGDDWAARIKACLDFFAVEDVRGWRERYEPMLAATQFRSTRPAADRPGAVAAWLRQGEREAASLDLRAWDPELFLEKLAEAKCLSRQKDPRVFVPALAQLFAEAGVATAVVHAPAGCPASGAARKTPEGDRVITLSARYLVDDHFWFTVMHEAAHLLLHDGGVFVDDLDPAGPPGQPEEREADAFAAEVLLPGSVRASVPARRLTARDVLRLSAQARVSPGVVVGQLQHVGAIDYSSLNHMKRRYRWNGGTLAPK